MKRRRTLSGKPRNVLRNWYGANTYIFLEAPNFFSLTSTEYQLLISDIYRLWHIVKIPYFNKSFIIHPCMLYGASPETTPRTPQFLIQEAIRNTYKFCSVSWGYSLAITVAMKHLKDGSERAAYESRQLSKSTIIVVRLRVIDFQNLWLIEMQRIKMETRMKLGARCRIP